MYTTFKIGFNKKKYGPICALRVLNPHQLSLAEQSRFKGDVPKVLQQVAIYLPKTTKMTRTATAFIIVVTYGNC